MAKFGKSSQHFTRRPALEEFVDFTARELERLRNSDREFDEQRYEQAVELVMGKLKRATRETAL